MATHVEVYIEYITFDAIEQYAKRQFEASYSILPTSADIPIAKVSPGHWLTTIGSEDTSSETQYRVLVGHLGPPRVRRPKIYMYLETLQGFPNSLVGEKFLIVKSGLREWRLHRNDLEDVVWTLPFCYLYTAGRVEEFRRSLEALVSYYMVAKGFEATIKLLYKLPDDFRKRFKAICTSISLHQLASIRPGPGPSEPHPGSQVVVLRLDAVLLTRFRSRNSEQNPPLAPDSSVISAPPRRRRANASTNNISVYKKRPRDADGNEGSSELSSNEATKRMKCDLAKAQSPKGRLHSLRYPEKPTLRQYEQENTVQREEAQQDAIITGATSGRVQELSYSTMKSTALQVVERNALRTEHGSKQTDNAAVITENKHLSDKLALAETRSASLTTENVFLKAQVYDLRLERDGLAREIGELKSQVIAVSAERDDLAVKNRGLEDQVTKSEEEMKTILGDFEHYKVRIRAIANEP